MKLICLLNMYMQAGGPFYPIELGRRDGLVSTATSVEGRLPHPNFNLDQLTSSFASRGLSQKHMIALSGNIQATYTMNNNNFYLISQTST